jgi:hypothetical protein
MKNVYLTPDSRNRVSLTKLSKNIASLYRASQINGKIILEPVSEIPAEEAWLFEPKNKEILERLLESIRQEPNKDLGSFEKRD